MDSVYAQAVRFSGSSTTNELFQKAVIEQKLNKRIADNIRETDKTISGLESPKELIRWAYEKEKGTVSEPLSFGSKYIVAVLTEVKEKGTAPLEFVKEQVMAKVVKEKKAEQFSKEMNDALAAGATIEAVAAKLKLNVEQAQNINFGSNALPNSGNEPAVTGAISGLKAKSISKPLVGNSGVFVVYVDAVTPAPEQKDFKAQQLSEMSQFQPRVDYEMNEALKENANITEHIVRFY